MSQDTLQQARSFVTAAALPAPPRALRSGGAAVAPLVPQAGRAQAAVVGSDVVSFDATVDPLWRQDLVNSTLLAQLAAKKKVPDNTRLFDWYDAYFDALGHIGWAVRDRSFSVYTESSENFQAHEAILKVAASLLGPTAASLALVTTTLEALQSMSADSPWITLLDRESRSASAAKFQVSVAEQMPSGELNVSLMAFGLEARSTMTQVLFFRSLASQVTLRHCSAKVAVDTVVLAGVRDALRARLVGFANDFVRQLPDL
jgi:hypothetical protein